MTPRNVFITASTLIFSATSLFAAPVDHAAVFARKFIDRELVVPTQQPLYRGTLKLTDFSDAVPALRSHRVAGRTATWNVSRYSDERYELPAVSLWIADKLDVNKMPYQFLVGLDTGTGPKGIVSPTVPPMIWLHVYGATQRHSLGSKAIPAVEFAPGTSRFMRMVLAPLRMSEPTGSLFSSAGGLGEYFVEGEFEQAEASTISFEDVRDSAYGVLIKAQQKGAIKKVGDDFVYRQAVRDLASVNAPGATCDSEGGRRLTYETIDYSIEYTIPAAAPTRATFRVTSASAPTSRTICTYRTSPPGFPAID